MLQFSNQQVQVGTAGANSPKRVLPDSGHGFRSYSQVCCRHFQCGSFGAEAGEKCRMGECCPSVTCCCMPAGTGRSSTWHGLLHVPDEFLSVSWVRVLHGPAATVVLPVCLLTRAGISWGWLLCCAVPVSVFV